jgi:hypothetical protein
MIKKEDVSKKKPRGKSKSKRITKNNKTPKTVTKEPTELK